MSTVTGKGIDKKIIDNAKKVVKKSGFQWEYFVTKALEKVFTEATEDGNVERFILRRKK